MDCIDRNHSIQSLRARDWFDKETSRSSKIYWERCAYTGSYYRRDTLLIHLPYIAFIYNGKASPIRLPSINPIPISARNTKTERRLKTEQQHHIRISPNPPSPSPPHCHRPPHTSTSYILYSTLSRRICPFVFRLHFSFLLPRCASRLEAFRPLHFHKLQLRWKVPFRPSGNWQIQFDPYLGHSRILSSTVLRSSTFKLPRNQVLKSKPLNFLQIHACRLGPISQFFRRSASLALLTARNCMKHPMSSLLTW